MVFATNRMANERYFKLLSDRAGPYRAASIGPKLAVMDLDGIRNTVSTNGLDKVAKKRRPNVEGTSDSRTNADTTPVEYVSMEKKKSFYAVKKIFGR